MRGERCWVLGGHWCILVYIGYWMSSVSVYIGIYWYALDVECISIHCQYTLSISVSWCISVYIGVYEYISIH